MVGGYQEISSSFWARRGLHEEMWIDHYAHWKVAVCMGAVMM